MDKQMSLSALNNELAQVRTGKREFLSQIDRIVPRKLSTQPANSVESLQDAEPTTVVVR
jgi:ribosome recycling factor